MPPVIFAYFFARSNLTKGSTLRGFLLPDLHGSVEENVTVRIDLYCFVLAGEGAEIFDVAKQIVRLCTFVCISQNLMLRYLHDYSYFTSRA